MKRLVFVCLPGLTTFVDQVADSLSNKFLVEKCYANNLTQVQQSIANADIVWIEWANEMAGAVTTNLLPLEKCKKVILRLHSYEALNPQYLQAINWGNVTNLVFVSQYIKDYVNGMIPQAIAHLNQHVVPNGLDLSDFSISDYKVYDSDEEAENDLLTIGMLGHLNNKKGLMMLAQSIYELHNANEMFSQVGFLIGGEWQDPRYETYFYHFLDKLDLMSVVDFQRVQYGTANKFFADIDVVLCTSPWESQNMSVMEGMASGCKPAIHWFPGAEFHYPEEYLWLTFDQLVTNVYYKDFTPRKYREHIAAGYDLHDIAKVLAASVLS